MEIISLLIGAWSNDHKKIFILAASFNLRSFGYFEKKPVREMSYALCRQLGERVLMNDDVAPRSSVPHEEYHCHFSKMKSIHAKAPLLGFAITKGKDLPSRIPIQILEKAMPDYMHDPGLGSLSKDWSQKHPFLEENVNKDPLELDGLLKAKLKVESVKVQMHENVKALLSNEEDLGDLLKESEDLSGLAKQFAKDSKKLKRCCLIL